MPEPNRRVLVVFEDRPALSIFRFLSPGFRHCFCLIEDRGRWILCDPLWSTLELRAYGVDEIGDPAALLGGERGLVLTGRRLASVDDPRPRWRPLTCVEVVKRVVGLPSRNVWTPEGLAKTLLALPPSTRFQKVA